MSEYMFGVGRGHLPKRAGKIAAQHGAELVNYVDPGCSCGHGCSRSCPANARHWFTAPNQGHPFDIAVERAVMADLRSAGLIDAAVAAA